MKLLKEFRIFSYLGETQSITYDSNKDDIEVELSYSHARFEITKRDKKGVSIKVKETAQPRIEKAYLKFVHKRRVIFVDTIRQEANRLLEDQRKYLEEFYAATNGDSWTNNTNWLSDKPLNEWYGIYVSSDERGVSRLSLKNNNLTGYIPRGISILRHTSVINLSENKLSGELPDELGRLYDTRLLYLNNNNFIGRLPDSFCGAPNTIFILRHNRLRGPIPQCILDSSNVEFCPQQEGYKFDNYKCEDDEL